MNLLLSHYGHGSKKLVNTVQPIQHSIRILIVEDEGIAARDLQRSLEDLGHAVIGIATSGAEAIELMSLVSVDLVLMDIRIKGEMDGIETADRIRQLYKTPVLYLTAYADHATLRRATATEPFGYLLKPFTPAAVASAMEIALKRFRLDQELKSQGKWLDTILNTVLDSIVVTDSDGDIQFINPAAEELIGWSCKDARSRALSELVELKVKDSNEKAFQLIDIVEGARVQAGSGMLTDRFGEQHFIAVSAAPICATGDERISGTVWAIRQSLGHRTSESMCAQPAP